MRLIKLTQEKFAKVDDEIFEYLDQFKWYAHKVKNTYYAQRGCKLKNGKRGNIHMHKIIMNTKNKIDHADRDGLNNQKSNLREATNSQNQMNKIGWGKSIFKGAHVQRGKYFAAHIKINGKQKHLGSFKTAEEAAYKYDEAALLNYGKFARLNFPIYEGINHKLQSTDTSG
jgi:hypothetical protein